MFQKAVRCFVLVALALSMGAPPTVVGATEAVEPNPPASIFKVLVSHVLTGTVQSDTHELIEIFNNSDEVVDITGWCIDYYQASGNMRSVCFEPETVGGRIILPARSPIVLASDHLAGEYEDFHRDWALAYRGLSEQGGAVIVRDGEIVIDGLAWGDGKPVEGAVVASPDRGMAIERKQIELGVLQDSDSNIDDFYHTEPRSHYVAGVVYEEFDVCLNIPLIQTSLPDGLYRDEATGECHEEPVVVVNECFGMVISEVAANSDRQFIELFNNSDEDVAIVGCRLATNRSDTVYYSLPDKQVEPGGYEVVFIEETELTLTKTTSGTVYLLSSDGGLEVDSVGYSNLRPATSWAKFGETDWRQTFNPTPGLANVHEQYLPCEEGYYRSEETGRCRKIIQESSLAPCPAGKERNPETNRCRNIASGSSELKPCREGQYRSEETNRCRNVASSTSSLVPCRPGQYRNPETNRCRKLEAAATLADCGEGRERNPETNRCRNIPGGSVPTAAFGAIPVADSPATMAGWWLFGGTAALAVGYAGWEWRREVYAALRQAATFFTSSDK